MEQGTVKWSNDAKGYGFINRRELRHLSNQFSELCSLDQPNRPFHAYAVSIEQMKSTAKALFWSLRKKQ